MNSEMKDEIFSRDATLRWKGAKEENNLKKYDIILFSILLIILI